MRVLRRQISRGDSVSIDRRVVAFLPLLPFYILPLQRQKPEMSIYKLSQKLHTHYPFIYYLFNAKNLKCPFYKLSQNLHTHIYK